MPKRWSQVTRVPAPALLSRAATASRCAAVGVATAVARESNQSGFDVIPSTRCAANDAGTSTSTKTSTAAPAAANNLSRMGPPLSLDPPFWPRW